MSESTSRLKKELGLFDVFAVSTGAMFSSGFFLLPGLAFAKTGPSVVFAYLVAGILILPAMFSKAELSTALPRAGGTYYFLDRSLGPIAGTIGGLGTYLALTLKTAFALFGIGAYAALFIDLPIKPVAISLTVVFVIVNALGAKETTTLQRWLVLVLLSVMSIFIVQAIVHVGQQSVEDTSSRLRPLFTKEAAGFLSTIGFVFVSYAGLTKVASVAEEVRNPDRNIPLGMILSLSVTTLVYVAGVLVIVAVVDPAVLATDLTPVATAAAGIFDWLPARVGLLLVVIAALAAFASTGNAGLLSASRYPFAMARDRLLPATFASLGRFQTPVPAIVATGGLMIGFIVLLDAEGIAKLASAFQLFIFILVNFSVIVMRESHLASYDPGYRTPLYPWMQLFGMLTSMLLIIYMGWEAVLFTFGVMLACLAWYFTYVASRVERHGAIYHWFNRLGLKQYDGLDREFRGIMKEKGLREEDPFDEIIAKSMVLDVEHERSFDDIVAEAAEHFAQRIPNTPSEIVERFMVGAARGETPVSQGVALPHFRTVSIEQAEIVLVRCHHPVAVPADDPLTSEIEPDQQVQAIFFLVSPDHNPAQHLRILAQLAGRVDEPGFMEEWTTAPDAHALREVLLRDERFVRLNVEEGSDAIALAGRRVRDVHLPPGCLIAVIHRDAESIIPSGKTILQTGDRITLIGQPQEMSLLREFYTSRTDGGIKSQATPRRRPLTMSGEPKPTAPAEVNLTDDVLQDLHLRLLFIASRSVDKDPKRAHEAIDALRRITAGTYGTCLVCGGAISEVWLRMRPDTKVCLNCRDQK